MITITPGKMTLTQLTDIYQHQRPVKLSAAADSDINAAAACVAKAASGTVSVYGVNTGFGKLAQTRIAVEQTAQLQRNLILSHCCGVGEPSATSVVRLMMVLKLNSLGRGASGVRLVIIRTLEQMLQKNLTPVVPCQGSVGASGDLAPLAHMAAVMLGEGEAFYLDQRISGAEAMQKAGIATIELAAKEGLALINGTQFSTAMALAGLFQCYRNAKAALVTGAMSTDAAMGSSSPFRPEIHKLRGHHGQIQVATALRGLMAGSKIRDAHREDDERVQDPYCLRCQPQVMGACFDLISQVAQTLLIEANAVTDNPLVVVQTSEILSGGNFHAEPVAFAADQLALAIAEIGAITERRIALLVDPALNFGLPAFLSPNPGVNSGFMIAEVSAAALYSENKQKAAPCSVDSTPTSANQEDHVSMAAHAARRLIDMNTNLSQIIAIEWLIASQGIELRSPLKTSPLLNAARESLRQDVAALGNDRYMANDLAIAARRVKDGALAKAVGLNKLPRIELLEMEADA